MFRAICRRFGFSDARLMRHRALAIAIASLPGCMQAATTSSCLILPTSSLQRFAPCTVGAHAAAKLPASIAATADSKRTIAAMSSARGKAVTRGLLARSRGSRHGMDLRPQLGPMEAERVLRGGERDRASPVNGERFCRSFCPLHRLSADRGARSHPLLRSFRWAIASAEELRGATRTSCTERERRDRRRRDRLVLIGLKPFQDPAYQ